MLHDAFSDPYAQKATGAKRRKEFDKLKRSKGFKAWRTRQLKIQEGLCAYCRVPLDKSNIVTHVDHVTPLRFDGTNDYRNFVLSCRRCNEKKWIATNYVVPEWIRKNDEKSRQRQRLNSRREAQYEQAKEMLVQMDRDLLSWIV